MIAKSMAQAYADLSEDQPARSILFVGFSAEESGLNGSRAFVDDPIWPLSDVSLMTNFDMIGRAIDGKVQVAGAETGVGLRAIIEAAVGDLIVNDRQVGGVICEDGRSFTAASVVLTTGTFLGGLIHLGNERTQAGRIGEAPSNMLATRLADLSLPLGRLKTGTPPRLDGRTIDWSVLEMQPADDPPIPFSMLTDRITVPQIECGITRTTAETHRIIAESMHLSAVFNGNISGQGPRYCPSIEDKVNRFADKDSHQLFLEPEGLDHHPPVLGRCRSVVHRSQSETHPAPAVP